MLTIKTLIVAILKKGWQCILANLCIKAVVAIIMAVYSTAFQYEHYNADITATLVSTIIKEFTVFWIRQYLTPRTTRRVMDHIWTIIGDATQPSLRKFEKHIPSLEGCIGRLLGIVNQIIGSVPTLVLMVFLVWDKPFVMMTIIGIFTGLFVMDWFILRSPFDYTQEELLNEKSRHHRDRIMDATSHHDHTELAGHIVAGRPASEALIAYRASVSKQYYLIFLNAPIAAIIMEYTFCNTLPATRYLSISQHVWEFSYFLANIVSDVTGLYSDNMQLFEAAVNLVEEVHVPKTIGSTFDISLKFPLAKLDLTFLLRKGINLIMGPSGSGKTSILRFLTYYQDGYTATVRDIENNASYVDDEASFQFSIISSYMVQNTVGLSKNDIAVGDLLDIETPVDKAVAFSLMSQLNLSDRITSMDDKINVDTVSGGQAQRLTIVRTLLRVCRAGTRVIAIDEPSTGLDPDNSIALGNLLKHEMQGILKDKIVALVTHDDVLINCLRGEPSVNIIDTTPNPGT